MQKRIKIREMDLKDMVLKAIENIAEKNNEDAKSISVEMTNCINNFMYFAVYDSKKNKIRNAKANYLWKMSDVLGLNALNMMSFNAYMTSRPKSIEEVYNDICVKNDFNPKQTVVQFKKEALENDNLIFSNEERELSINYKELMI